MVVNKLMNRLTTTVRKNFIMWMNYLLTCLLSVPLVFVIISSSIVIIYWLMNSTAFDLFFLDMDCSQCRYGYLLRVKLNT